MNHYRRIFNLLLAGVAISGLFAATFGAYLAGYDDGQQVTIVVQKAQPPSVVVVDNNFIDEVQQRMLDLLLWVVHEFLIVLKVLTPVIIMFAIALLWAMYLDRRRAADLRAAQQDNDNEK